MAEIIRSALLEGVPHGFSTREGLVGADVAPGAVLVKAKQVHSPDVAVVTDPAAYPGEVDALVTAARGIILGIVTADCTPVLLADREAGVIGAAHAGWRGAFGGVLENTVAAMEALGADRAGIRAVLGPCIAQSSYEVDSRFREPFAESDAKFFAAGNPGHWQFDLPAYVVHRLRATGVGVIEDLSLDTYADERRFFSYRRATHRGEPTGGRQTSAIALPQ